MLVTRPHPPTADDDPVPVHRIGFRVMGTDAEVVVVDGPPGLLDRARRRLEVLEARWSRFRPDSDVSRLNRWAGRPVVVDHATILLVERAIAGARATGGRYDPTVGRALVAHGYDRSFAEVAGSAADLRPRAEVDGSWPAIEVDTSTGQVRLPEGTLFDPGGIGKGLAADLVSAELAAEADGILVDLGGDVRMRGRAPDPAGWVVSIADPRGLGGELGRLAVPEGAVATSSDRRRRWRTAAGWAHHVIDPRTGRPACSDVMAVTTVANDAWWAEVQATSLFVAGTAGLADLDDTVEALVLTTDGSRRATPGLTEVLG